MYSFGLFLFPNMLKVKFAKYTKFGEIWSETNENIRTSYCRCGLLSIICNFYLFFLET